MYFSIVCTIHGFIFEEGLSNTGNGAKEVMREAYLFNLHKIQQ